MSDKDIVDRLKAEGQLLRNTGANSIKGMIDRFDRFAEVMTEVNIQLMEQTAILRSLLSSQESVLRIEEERKKLDSLKVEPSQPQLLPNGKPPPANPLPDQGNNPISDILGGAAGGLAAMMSGWFLRRVGVGAVIAFIAPVIGEWLGKFTEELLLSADFKGQFASAIGEAVGASSMTYLVLRAFGKKFAALAATGAFAASFADEVVNAMGLDGEMVVANLFGKDLNVEDMVGGILGALGLGITTYLTSAGFRKMAGQAISTAIAATPKMAMFKAGIAGSIVSLYLMYGDEAKKAIENMGVPESIANIAVDAAGIMGTTMTLGAMFGPAGILVGAAAGLAIVFGKTIYDWLKGQESVALERLNESLEEINKQVADQGYVDPETLRTASPVTQQEIIDRAGGQDVMDRANAGDEEAKKKIADATAQIEKEKMESIAKDKAMAKIGQISQTVSPDEMTYIDNAYEGLLELKKLGEQGIDIADELSEAKRLISASRVGQDYDSQDVTGNLQKLLQFEEAGSFTPVYGTPPTIPPDTSVNPASQTLDLSAPAAARAEQTSQLSSGSETASMMQVIPMSFSPVNTVNSGGNSHSTTIINNVGPMNDLDKPLYA